MIFAFSGHILCPGQHLLTHSAIGLAEGTFHLQSCRTNQPSKVLSDNCNVSVMPHIRLPACQFQD